MMDNPFVVNRDFGYPFGLPYQQYPHHLYQTRPRPRPRPKPSPKVVTIPVHFAGSDHLANRSAVEWRAALKVQKVFRGFLVRRSMKKIKSIAEAVEEIEKTVEKEETVELIRSDSRERLRVNETLMSLLFQLDSIRGIDSGVRDCRKKVIKKAIALQETLDAIAAAAAAATDVDSVNETLTSVDSVAGDTDNAELRLEAVDHDHVEESQSPPLNVKGNVEEEQLQQQKIAVENNNENTTPFGSESAEEGSNNKKKQSGGSSSSKREEILESLVEENEKMMDLLSELLKRDQMQTRLLSSLSCRVEQLERAILRDRAVRNKKMKKTKKTKKKDTNFCT